MGRKIIAHGTRNTYERHGCRCDLCRAANAKRSAAYASGHREYMRESERAAYLRDPERRKSSSARWRDADPRRNAAHNKVREALRKGDLVRGECARRDGTCVGRVLQLPAYAGSTTPTTDATGGYRDGGGVAGALPSAASVSATLGSLPIMTLRIV